MSPYRFSIVRWESKVIFDEANQLISGRNEKIDGEVHVVIQYFSLVQRMETLQSEIEAINSGSRHGESALLEAMVRRQWLNSEASSILCPYTPE